MSITNRSSFKLDTGADATVLPKHLFDQRFNEHLLPADKCLCGPNRAKLDVAGYFMATLEWKQKRVSHKVYVIRDVHQPLLGRDAIDNLGLIKRIAVVASNNNPTLKIMKFSPVFHVLHSRY